MIRPNQISRLAMIVHFVKGDPVRRSLFARPAVLGSLASLLVLASAGLSRLSRRLQLRP